MTEADPVGVTFTDAAEGPGQEAAGVRGHARRPEDHPRRGQQGVRRVAPRPPARRCPARSTSSRSRSPTSPASSSGPLVPSLTAITTFFVKNPGIAKAIVIGVLGIAAAMVRPATSRWRSRPRWRPLDRRRRSASRSPSAPSPSACIEAYKNSETFRASSTGLRRREDGGDRCSTVLQANWPLLRGSSPTRSRPPRRSSRHLGRPQDRVELDVEHDQGHHLGAFSAPSPTPCRAPSGPSPAISSAWTRSATPTEHRVGRSRSSSSDVVGDVKARVSGLGTWITGCASGTFAAVMSRGRVVLRPHRRRRTGRRRLGAAQHERAGQRRRPASSTASAAPPARSRTRSRRPINAVIDAWNGHQLHDPEDRTSRRSRSARRRSAAGRSAASRSTSRTSRSWPRAASSPARRSH